MIIINCSKLDELNSVGVHELIKLQQIYDDNIIISFINAKPKICKFISKYGLDQVFVIKEKNA